MALFLLALVVASGQSFDCTPTRVWDGDGPIWCVEGPRVRLSGIAAREIDGTCSVGHPCPQASAEKARDTLVRLVGKPVGQSKEGHIIVRGPVLKCKSLGGAGGNRTAAWCVSPIWGDLSCAMIKSGTAMKWFKYWKKHEC
jgi:endonuclease YncB( thermonuclease family)